MIGLDLCPFANAEWRRGRIRFSQSPAQSEEQLLNDLAFELEFLTQHPEVETTLLIHPSVLLEFSSYNQFLDEADALLTALDLQGVFQIASFHPQYQFAGTKLDDAENYTNRSPYPLLHVLREAGVESAVARYPDTQSIPLRNVERMQQMGLELTHQRWQLSFNEKD